MTNTPKYFAFNITNRCQSHCATCNGWQTPKSTMQYELSTNDWKFILREMKEWLGEFDFIFSGGEPFIREDIFDIADYAKQIGLIPKVITNGLALKNKCEKLINSGFKDITVSLNSAKNPQIHNLSRGLKNGFEITSNVIKDLARLNREKNAGKTILISSIIMPSNLSELVALAEFAHNNEIGINYQLLDNGDAFFLAKTMQTENAKLFNDLKELTLKEIDRLIELKSNRYLIYNPISQLEAFKEQIVNSKVSVSKDGNAEIPDNRIEFRPTDNNDFEIKDKINITTWGNSGIQKSEKQEIEIVEGNCQIGNYNFLIDPFGFVRVCFTFEPIGSLVQNKPKDIWESQKAFEIRQKTAHCNKSCKLLNCNYHE